MPHADLEDVERRLNALIEARRALAAALERFISLVGKAA